MSNQIVRLEKHNLLGGRYKLKNYKFDLAYSYQLRDSDLRNLALAVSQFLFLVTINNPNSIRDVLSIVF